MLFRSVEKIIKTAALLKKRFSNFRLLVIGADLEEKKLAAGAQKYQLAGSVEFVGDATRAEKWYLYKTSQFGILNLAEEEMLDVVVECLAAELPIIAVDAPIANEAALNDQSNFLVRADSETEIAEAASKMLKNYDSGIQESLIKNAPETLAKNFSWAAHIRVLIDFFKTLRNSA